MKLTITLDTDNDIFKRDLLAEVDRILMTVPNRMLLHPRSKLRDRNGNTVGEFCYE